MDVGDRNITDQTVDWVLCRGSAHGPDGQWFHAACQGLFSSLDIQNFKTCFRCHGNQRSEASPNSTVQMCSPRCPGCNGTCDKGMDFLTEEQRGSLWKIVSQHESSLKSLQIPQPGEHVFVIPDGVIDGSSTSEAKLLHCDGQIALLVYLDDKTKAHRVDIKLLNRPVLNLQEKLFRRRIPEFAIHVGCPFGPKQAWHEIFRLRRIYRKEIEKKMLFKFK